MISRVTNVFFLFHLFDRPGLAGDLRRGGLTHTETKPGLYHPTPQSPSTSWGTRVVVFTHPKQLKHAKNKSEDSYLLSLWELKDPEVAFLDTKQKENATQLPHAVNLDRSLSLLDLTLPHDFPSNRPHTCNSPFPCH